MIQIFCDICNEKIKGEETGRCRDITGTALFVQVKKGAGPSGKDIRHRHEVPFSITLDTSKNFIGFDICADCILKGVTEAVNEINHPATALELKLGTEEGEKCNRDDCSGVIAIHRDGPCQCHINPPCHACEHAKLACEKCGWEKDEGNG